MNDTILSPKHVTEQYINSNIEPVARFKSKIKSKIYHKKTQALLNLINQNPKLIRLFTDKPQEVQNIILKYINRKFSHSDKMACIRGDFKFALEQLPDDFFTTTSATIAHIDDDFTVKIARNPVNSKEGLWLAGLSYKDTNLFMITYTVGYQNKLTIGSIQGGNQENASEIIKLATKRLHGMRPQQFVIWLAGALSQSLSLSGVEAVSFENHITTNFSRVLRKKGKFIANYNDIWQSYDGIRDKKSGNWHLPPMKMKSIEEIASKKRAMYRRRYEMLDNVQTALNAYFTSPQGEK